MLPADVANRALDAVGVEPIGDLQEGTRQAQVVLRTYGASLRQLLRAAHWNFARSRRPLVLLNDATGQTTQEQGAAGGPVTVGTGTPGMRPWLYEYAWPVDCVKARWVPASRFPTNLGPAAGNISLPSTPQTTAASQFLCMRELPTRFLVTNDVIPNLIGVPETWDDVPQTAQTMGQALTNQTVVLSNQPCAHLVYTALMTYPDQWDPLFTEAFVALLASRVALRLVPDPKQRIAIRDEQIKIAQMALSQARVSDGDEGWETTDNAPDWLRVRSRGGAWGSGSWAGVNDIGVLGYGWDSIAFGNGSAY